MTIFSRFAKIGIPVAAAILTGSALGNKRRGILTASAATVDSEYSQKDSFLTAEDLPDVEKPYNGFPRNKWDNNWDK